MLLQLSEENKKLLKGLFKKRQPNNSALWCYLTGIMPGKAYVDDINCPTKAICVLDMSWTYVSDDADFDWINETIQEICKTAWLQVIWDPAERGQRPSTGSEEIIPRFEYTERKAAAQNLTQIPAEKTVDTDFLPFNGDLFDKLEWKDFHIQVYGSKENFLKKAFGFYAVQNGEICSEFEAAFSSGGYTEIGIITAESKRHQGFAYATCLHGLEEIRRRGLKPIWACDQNNLESNRLAQKLGFINPFPYEFLFFPQQESTASPQTCNEA